MSQNDDLRPLSPDELAAETGAALPDKEVISLLDLNADVDLALDAAAPIDLAVAANANVAAPIDAAVAANVGSVGSSATAIADQDAVINQHLDDVSAEALVAVTAVKGLGRFAELRAPAAAERFIVGTLASGLWAAACVGVAVLLRG